MRNDEPNKILWGMELMYSFINLLRV